MKVVLFDWQNKPLGERAIMPIVQGIEPTLLIVAFSSGDDRYFVLDSVTRATSRPVYHEVMGVFI